jgi:hypothetical protein
MRSFVVVKLSWEDTVNRIGNDHLKASILENGGFFLDFIQALSRLEVDIYSRESIKSWLDKFTRRLYGRLVELNTPAAVSVLIGDEGVCLRAKLCYSVYLSHLYKLLYLD